jgi:hypothetical protein
MPPVRLLISGTQAACTASGETDTPGVASYTIYKTVRFAVAGIGVSEYLRVHGLYMALTFRLPGQNVVMLAGALVRQSRHSVAL